MINPRKWEWPAELFEKDDPDITFITYIPVIGFGWAPAVGVAALLDIFLPANLFFFSLFFAWLLVALTPAILAFSNVYRGMDSYDVMPMARKYLHLPKSDRKEFFPDNYMEMLQNYDDMDIDERRALRRSSDEIFQNIRARNEVIARNAQAERKAGMGTEDFFDELNRRKEYARVEAETYRELM